MVLIRARKIINNKLLSRRQMIIDVTHPGEPPIKRSILQEKIAQKVNCDARNIQIFGFKTVFGGGRSTGFCLIYDSQQYLLKYEPKHRLRRIGVLPKKGLARKAFKELKSKCKKVRGKEITRLTAGKLENPGKIKKLKEAHLKGFK